MTVLTTIANGASYKDIRDTWNSMLARLGALEAGVSSPALALSSAVIQAEGNGGTTNFIWTLTLTRNGSTASFPFTWAITGNGSNPADPADFGGALPAGGDTFAPGETSKTISVPVTGDTAVEPAETFLLTAAATGLNSVSSVGTISNDDTAGIQSIRIVGDSITYFAGAAGRFASLYAAARTDKTITVNADNSRTVGGASYNGEAADNGTTGTLTAAAQNTLLAQRANDLASGAQLITTMIGTNDLQTFSVATEKSRLIDYAGPIRAAGVKFAWSPPPSLRSDKAYGATAYDAFMAKRAALLAVCRDPAWWGTFADSYNPFSEHPDLNAADNIAYISGDGVHWIDPGHAKAFEAYKAWADSFLDASRVSSTSMYGFAWIAGEASLPTSTAIVRRIIVSGLAHGGIALTGGNALSVAGGGAQLRRGGDAGPGWAASYTGWLYNGDVIELRLTTAATPSTNTDVALTIGTETRTLTYATGVAATPVSYTAGGYVDDTTYGATHSMTINVPVAGVLVMGVKRTAAAVSAITVGPAGAPVSAFKRGPSTTGAAGYGDVFDMWTVPVTAGSRAINVTNAGASAQTVIGWLVVQGADPTPVQAVNKAVGNASAPHLTDQYTVPAYGLAVAFFGEYGGTAAPAGDGVTASTGSTFVSKGYLVNPAQAEGNGMVIAVRGAGTNVTTSFDGPFGSFARGAVVFKAAGT